MELMDRLAVAMLGDARVDVVVVVVVLIDHCLDLL
jgi:hypothetical protein